MLKSFLLIATLSLQASPADKGATLTGSLAPTVGLAVSTKVQVILFPPPYAAAWDADAQRRVDDYWETYRLAFIREKELFIGVSRVAHHEATELIMSQMGRDSRIRMADNVRDITLDGKFEFKNLTLGGYKIVALGQQGGRDGPIWEATVEFTNTVPQSIQLKSFP
jgi:hypothetical protein